ncbi:MULTISPECIES: hypothetical protein [unclassified Guyparkeria]|uniref:hypothetical protein n=1 Tax=unclassified Guyparkeria TaxID=2626246 RepID=UPI00073377EA|nr:MULTISPECIES: hypothetical protein [unclassified Guyparkeria]KTG16603.1 hypothetical protein AUR63_00625 [Guyparkeria sp. XI15]OAE85637.1 hypothetical protein AWR35_00625 [Guyparkeria sp. WRN-7]
MSAPHISHSGAQVPTSSTRLVARLFGGLIALLLLAASWPATAAKAPQLIRSHILDQIEVKVEPFHAPAIDELFTVPVWTVATKMANGTSHRFMAVKDGEVIRVHRGGTPRVRDGFVRLLPDDFRVESQADAERVFAAAIALNFNRDGKPEIPLDAMRIEKQGSAYYAVDGERFGKATGYRLDIDKKRRVMQFEYSWKLPVAPLKDES